MDAYRVEQLMKRGVTSFGDLLQILLGAARDGLSHYLSQGELREPSSRRLAFRELGLSIGLSAIERIAKNSLRAELEALTPHVALAEAIGSFWLDPEHRQNRSWSEHRHINDVMLATALVPDGFLIL